MTPEEAVARIRNYHLPPHVLAELGLEEGWQESVGVEFIADVLRDIRRYAKVLEGLK